MRLSEFAQFVSIEKDVVAVFNSLLMRILYVDKKTAKLIKELKITDDKTIDFLFESYIYVNHAFEDEALYLRRRTEVCEFQKKLHTMYLCLSADCNLACKYCYIEQNPCKGNVCGNMTMETAKNAIDKFKKEIEKYTTEDNVRLILFGGEPLMNINLVKPVVNYIRKVMPKVLLGIVTNGTLLTEDIAKFLKKNKCKITISIDGPKCINDKNRIFANSSASVYDVIGEKVKILQKNNIPFDFSTTISEDVLKNQDIANDYIKEFKPQGVNYNLLHYSDDKEGEKKCVDFYGRMAKFSLENYDKLKELSTQNNFIEQGLDMVKNRVFRHTTCVAVGLNVVDVKFNGDVCVCSADIKTKNHVIGNVNTMDFEEMLNNPELSFFINSAAIKRPQCRSCEAIFVCGGGCPYQAKALYGSSENLDKPICNYSKTILKWYLKKIYEERKPYLNIENKEK